MNQKTLQYVEINPKTQARACVIWLHGLGADRYDFVNVVPELQLSEDLAIRFVFPHAPIRPVSINAGYSMRAWFDIYALHTHAPQDEKGIKETQIAIEKLIENEMQLGIPSEKIILAGFSQGGAMALYCGLHYSKSLAGILGLSTFLPLHEKLNPVKNPANLNTPIMLAHGVMDQVVPIQLGERCRDQLMAMNYSVSWHSYPMQHEVCRQEIRDIGKWITSLIAKS